MVADLSYQGSVDRSSIEPRLTHALVLIALTGLLVSNSIPAAAFGVLSALGVRRAIREGLSPRDRMLLAVLAILPLYVAFNMAFTGWSAPAMQRPVRLLLAWAAYIQLSRTGLSRRTCELGVLAALALGGIWAVWKIIDGATGRIAGAEGPIHFGNFGLLLGLVALAGAFATGSQTDRTASEARTRVYGLMGFVTGLWLSAVSGTRAGWLALLLVLPPLLYSVLSRVRKPHRWLLAVLMTASMVAIGVTAGVQDRVGTARQELEQIIQANDLRDVSTSIGLRAHMWELGAAAFMNKPLMGIGVGNLHTYLEAGIASGTMNPELTHHRHLHNDLVTSLATGGLLGGAALSALWFGLLAFFRSTASGSPDATYFSRAGFIVSAATIVFSLTDSMFGTSTGINSFVILVGVFAGGFRYAELHPRRLQNVQA